MQLKSRCLEVLNLVAVFLSSEWETALLKTGKECPNMFVYTMLTFVSKVSRQIRCRCDKYEIFYFTLYAS